MPFHSTEDSVRAVLKNRSYRLITALGGTGIVLACGLLIGNGSTSRADDPPKPAETSDAIARRINRQHERFMHAFAPMADVFEELKKAVDRAKDQLPDQMLRTEDAKHAYKTAELAREVAEMALKEYETGIFKQEESEVEGKLKSAKAGLDDVNIAGRERRLEATVAIQKAFQGSRPDPAVKVLGELLIGESVEAARGAVLMEEVRLKQAEFEVERAETARDILHRFNRPKRLAELRADIEKAKSDELTKQVYWDRELKKQEALISVISGRSRPWTSAEKALISVLGEISELGTKRSRLLDADDQPRPADAEIEKLFAAIDAKLVEADRAADRVRRERADSALTLALDRVREAARRLREKP